MIGIVLDTAVLLALTLGGLLQWLSSMWEAVLPLQSLWHGVVLIVTVVVLRMLIGLPLTLYRTFVIEQRFGFNKMTAKLFVVDMTKGIVLGAVIGIPLLVAVLWLMGAAGRWWWLYVWIVLAAFAIVMQLIVPTFIMPWFNKFSPLQDPALVERVERLLVRCGFRSKGLYVMDGSKRSAHGNAFFAGVGTSKRIVLFDTLVERLSPGEVEAVLAHELGHYKLNHIKKMLAIGFAETLAGLFILGLLVDQNWFYAGLGVQSQTLAIALLLFMLVSPAFTYFLEPLQALRSRKHEYEADTYATQHAQAADLTQALVKLYKDNAATLTPDPLHSAFYDSHPPAAMRIARLRTA
jgi:STE24 endopeptidase